MQTEQTRSFKKSLKRLHPKQKKNLDEAIKLVMKDPQCGKEKKGDLAGVRVYKFKMVNCLNLLAYTYDDSCDLITLLKLSSHENYYRDLKNEMK
jgi:mRNA-degrading endonuclease RelE of RelBE toxin-antitoxin system